MEGRYSIEEMCDIINGYIEEASKEEADKAFDEGLKKRIHRQVNNKDYHKFMADSKHIFSGENVGKPKLRGDIGSGKYHDYGGDNYSTKTLGSGKDADKYLSHKDAYRKTIRKKFSDSNYDRGGRNLETLYMFNTDATKRMQADKDKAWNKYENLSDKLWKYDVPYDKADAIAKKAAGKKILTKAHKDELEKKKDRLRQNYENIDKKQDIQRELYLKARDGKLSPANMKKFKEMYPADYAKAVKENTELKLDIFDSYENGLITESEKYELLNMLEYNEGDE